MTYLPGFSICLNCAPAKIDTIAEKYFETGISQQMELFILFKEWIMKRGGRVSSWWVFLSDYLGRKRGKTYGIKVFWKLRGCWQAGKEGAFGISITVWESSKPRDCQYEALCFSEAE